jgi:hypothetical protein
MYRSRPKGQPFRGDDIAQFAAFGAFDLDIPFGNQPFEMPVYRPHRDAETRCEGCLRNIGVLLDFFEKREFADGFFAVGHEVSKIQSVNYNRNFRKGEKKLPPISRSRGEGAVL